MHHILPLSNFKPFNGFSLYSKYNPTPSHGWSPYRTWSLLPPSSTGSSLTFSLGKFSPSKYRWWTCPSLSGDTLTQVFACLPYLFLALCWAIIYIVMKVNNLMVFSVCSELCNHHHNLISGYFHRPPKKSCTIISSHIHSPASLSSPRQTPVYVLSLQIWLFWTFYINETIKYMVFGGWLPCDQETTPLT